jgi:hypothetical protein
MKGMLLAAAGGLAIMAFASGAQGRSVHRHTLNGVVQSQANQFDCGAAQSRRSRGVVVCDGFGGWYGGEWALYNNRSWESDSYNDWWHDRPDRAYPAWMRRNQDCSRPWYSGDTLTC